MASTVVRSGTREPETEPGPFLGLLLRRPLLVLLAALVLMVLAGVVGRDAGDKLVSGAYRSRGGRPGSRRADCQCADHCTGTDEQRQASCDRGAENEQQYEQGDRQSHHLCRDQVALNWWAPAPLRRLHNRLDLTD